MVIKPQQWVKTEYAQANCSKDLKKVERTWNNREFAEIWEKNKLSLRYERVLCRILREILKWGAKMILSNSPFAKAITLQTCKNILKRHGLKAYRSLKKPLLKKGMLQTGKTFAENYWACQNQKWIVLSFLKNVAWTYIQKQVSGLEEEEKISISINTP